jgi:type IV pilus assembly protein PilA
LVELMIIVAIIGILATIGLQNFRGYFAQARSVEALSTLGAIGRAVHMAAERDRTDGAVLAAGQSSFVAMSATKVTGSTTGKGKGSGSGTGATVVHGSSGGLCGNATSVPQSFAKVQKQKYQPSAASGVDYNTGDSVTGWKCLRFSVDDPQYYQYSYGTGGAAVDVTLPKGGRPPGLSEDHSWNATARGDIDGDGKSSWFVLEGYITTDGRVVQAPWIGIQDSEE